MHEPETDSSRVGSQELLVELSARLGEGTAGLAETIRRFGNNWTFNSEIPKFRRLSNLNESEDWWLYFAFKSEPRTDRLLRTVKMLA